MSDETLEPSESPTLPVSQETSTIIKKRYRIEKELGRGGMGVVYLAHDQELHNRPVVIKVLRDFESGEWHTKKFRQEIEALVRIEHPGIVGVFDAGEMPNGQLFVVMQFVEGVTLRSIMKEGPIDRERVARIMEQIGLALNAAHEKGILHCDLKPENIMLQQLQRGYEAVKLIDFGVAKIRDSQVTSSHSTKIAGTIAYMAPEQMNGAPCLASDIFSLGVIAYEILAHQKPFPAENIVQLIAMHRTGVRTNAKELCPELPAAVDPILLKALEYDPAARYQNAIDFTEALVKALRQSPEESPAAPQTVRPSGWLALVVIASLVVTALILFFTLRGLNVATKRASLPPASSTVRVQPLPTLQLTYSILVQKYRDGKAFEKPFRLASEINFEHDYHLQLEIRAPQSGYFYMLNEGPVAKNGSPQYVVLFPTPSTNNNSTEIAENQEIQTGWFVFDTAQGTEKIWMIFSPKPVAELEGIKRFANQQARGKIDDPAAISSISGFLKKYGKSKIETLRDADNQQTILKVKGDVLVHQLLLEHN